MGHERERNYVGRSRDGYEGGASRRGGVGGGGG